MKQKTKLCEVCKKQPAKKDCYARGKNVCDSCFEKLRMGARHKRPVASYWRNWIIKSMENKD